MQVKTQRIRRAFLWILRVRGASRLEGVLARARSSVAARQILAEELEDDRWLDEELVEVEQAQEGGADGLLLRAAAVEGASAKAGEGNLFDRLKASTPEPELEICEPCEGEGCDNCDEGWVEVKLEPAEAS